ncbi:MAG TPA: hypothetical protein VLT87_07400 [Thermoanaerobaculia bacterium]|nr:hypothetical protein [Thermoanaerobaculia bacterium]
MKTTIRALFLIAALSLTANAAEAYKPIACSECSCRVQCGTLCTKSDGTFSVCGLGGSWCEGMPVCYG